MAYLLSHFWPGATEDQYRATIAVVHPPDGLPEGQTFPQSPQLLGSVWRVAQ